MTNRPEGKQAETMISVAVLRRLCGAQPGEIERLIRSNAITMRGGQVSLVAGVRAYLDGIRTATKSASLAAAQDAARTARADAAELALAVDDRRLVKQSEADDAIAQLCGAVMSRTFTIPARVTRDVAARRLIEARIRAVQVEIADGLRAAETAADLAPTRSKARGHA